jgi:allantoin racemase
VRQAETLAILKPRKAVAGTVRRPDPKPTIGLAEPLAALIEHRRPSDAKGGSRP